MDNAYLPRIGWLGEPIRGTGYGEESHAIVSGLRARRFDVAVLERDEEWLEDSNRGRLLIGNRPFKPLPSWTAPWFRIWRTTFETSTLPEEWVTGLNMLGEVWVPSTFNVETFRNSGVTVPVVNVPAPLDLRPHLSIDRTDRRGTGPFTFLAVATWSERKGWDRLLTAYFSEFTHHDDVRLVIRTRRYPRAATDVLPRLREIADRYGHTEAGLPTVVPILDSLSAEGLLELYARADAFVLASRGEGWGLPYMEAMAAELPTIGTGWGGHLDYMNSSNSFLIDSSLAPVSEQAALECPLFAGKQWAEPDVDHLRVLLRRVFEGGPEVDRIARTGRATVGRDFPMERCIQGIIDRISCHA